MIVDNTDGLSEEQRGEQAAKWLEENRQAIEAYIAKQAEKGETFSQWAGQL